MKPTLPAILFIALLATPGPAARADIPPEPPPPAPTEVAPAPPAPVPSEPTRPTTTGTPASGSVTRIHAAGLVFELPQGWLSVPPASEMRAAELKIPGPGGDAELAVFSFGAGQGGDVESNLARWEHQVEAAPGASPKREAFPATHDLKVTLIDVSGTLQPSPMGGSPEPRPGSRLIGAVVEGGQGPWFFKATGPEATVAAARTDLVKLLQGLAPE